MSVNLNINQIHNLLEKGDMDSVQRSMRVNVERPGATPGVGSLEDRPNLGGVGSFVTYLKNAVDEANHLQIQADRAAKALASGKTKNVHETMMTMEKAEVALKTAMAIRGKLLEAYKEVMRMNI